MSEGLLYLLAALVGGVAALFYFAGLWLTVQKLANSSRPYLLLGASFLARAALVLALFYAVARAGMVALLLAAAGFILTRVLLTHRWGVGTRKRRDDRGHHADAG